MRPKNIHISAAAAAAAYCYILWDVVYTLYILIVSIRKIDYILNISEHILV